MMLDFLFSLYFLPFLCVCFTLGLLGYKVLELTGSVTGKRVSL